jgi:two-component system, OmpR family, response regulator QseB
MRVLLVEDEFDIAVALKRALEAQSLEVRHAATLRAARETLLDFEPDLMILDVGLPESQNAGFTLAQEARAAGFTGSIVFMTARDAIADRVHGLDGGGDDYVVKPFDLLEFLARVRALLRRPTQARASKLVFDSLELDFTAGTVRFEGRNIELSKREYDLLERLALSPDRVFSAEELLDLIWGDAASSVGVVKVFVHHLRQKLSAQAIVSSRRGYQLGFSSRNTP